MHPALNVISKGGLLRILNERTLYCNVGHVWRKGQAQERKGVRHFSLDVLVATTNVLKPAASGVAQLCMYGYIAVCLTRCRNHSRLFSLSGKPVHARS